MNLTFFDAGKDLLAHDCVVKTPSFVLLPTLVTDIPETVLYLSWVKLSKSIAEAHVYKVSEGLAFFRGEACHILVSFRVKNIDFLMSNI